MNEPLKGACDLQLAQVRLSQLLKLLRDLPDAAARLVDEQGTPAAAAVELIEALAVAALGWRGGMEGHHYCGSVEKQHILIDTMHMQV